MMHLFVISVEKYINQCIVLLIKLLLSICNLSLQNSHDIYVGIIVIYTQSYGL